MTEVIRLISNIVLAFASVILAVFTGCLFWATHKYRKATEEMAKSTNQLVSTQDKTNSLMELDIICSGIELRNTAHGGRRDLTERATQIFYTKFEDFLNQQ